ncbi:4'-phosphopantetheinyl transferase family protein [Microbacterium sp. MAHUQ-60]|uniref:4'-phosphopantetheinyl transferase family protein n=1 Tax=unclassified Microbacterium TaxID=2609290 RepID=UPI00361A8042
MRIESLWEAVQAAADSSIAPEAGLWRMTAPHIDSRGLDDAVRRGWLTESERTNAGRRAGPVLQSRFGARRMLRRLVVAASLGADPSEVSVEAQCVDCGGTSHGRPHVVAPGRDAPGISTSSIEDRMVVALGKGSIGVDIESSGRAAGVDGRQGARAIAAWERIAQMCPSHATTVEVWSALEALSKTTGRGLLASPAELDVAIAEHRLEWVPDAGDRTICVAVPAAAPILTTIDIAF